MTPPAAEAARFAAVSAQEDLIRRAYDAFNARDIDAVLAMMHPEVDWPNVIESRREHGHAAVRRYWTHQFGLIDSRVVPTGFSEDDQGRLVVDVHQRVRDAAGELIADQHVQHLYTFRDGLIARMDVRELSPASGPVRRAR
jgi:ketosteroid isomerase-like protein